MKELTIQDKAELYDKALKQIKDCTPDENGFVTICPKEIFTELKESEEEIMKNDLIDYFEELPDLICNGEHIEGSYRGHYKKDIIAWLEKQGNKDEEILILKDQIESLHAAIKALKEAHKIELEKQGEQNPTWSEDDEIRLKDQIESLGAAIKALKETHKIELEKQNKQNTNILWHDVSEEPEMYCELLCEWYAKGDINHITSFHDVAFYHTNSKTFWNGEQQIENVVKWTYVDEMLKKQGEQNPTWSEYDEVMLHSIISDFKGFKHDNTSSLEPHFDNVIDWLKSLKDRYTWKPTEEQINAIKLARNSFVRNDSSGYSFINKILFKLENQLKKMMEE